jgi:hypothetical protein
VISKENEKNAEKINNLVQVIAQMMATGIHHPENPSLEIKTVAAFNRVRISGSGGNNSGFRKVVRFRSDSPQRSRSQTLDKRRTYSRESSYQDPNQNSTWGNQK